jgi:hypothetical protein
MLDNYLRLNLKIFYVKNNHLGFEEILNYNMDLADTPDNVTMSLS